MQGKGIYYHHGKTTETYGRISYTIILTDKQTDYVGLWITKIENVKQGWPNFSVCQPHSEKSKLPRPIVYEEHCF